MGVFRLFRRSFASYHAMIPRPRTLDAGYFQLNLVCSLIHYLRANVPAFLARCHEKYGTFPPAFWASGQTTRISHQKLVAPALQIADKSPFSGCAGGDAAAIDVEKRLGWNVNGWGDQGVSWASLLHRSPRPCRWSSDLVKTSKPHPHFFDFSPCILKMCFHATCSNT